MKMTVRDIDVKNKRCLVRVDFNVPLDGETITDDNRIVGALPTIEYLRKNGARVILCSHFGRPKGQFNLKYSLRPVSVRLNELGVENMFVEDCVGEKAENAVKAMKEGDVILLENLRFYKEEEANDREFSRKLASLADIYVDDAFGTSHRAHASTVGVTEFLKTAVSGFLIEKELEIMGGALSAPVRPFIAILGGAKVSDKIGVIENLLGKVDYLLVGGGMAYTFYKALGYEIGNSLCEDDKVGLAKELLDRAKTQNIKLLLPVDNVVAKSFSNDAEHFTVRADKIPADCMGMDIGADTIGLYADIIHHAKTVIWNGPLGVFEMPNYATGTKKIAQAVAETQCVSIIGGGDSTAAVTGMGYKDKVTHISTGGGASLEFLEGKELPGIACLNDLA
ncbi:MAG: phosphoglycerate kinase [Clostridia bacterium]|nr:phosphoglycerate kinase [Clostridia bacterium]